MNHQEKIRIDNFKEHHRRMKSLLVEINSEVEVALAKKEDAEAALASVDQELEDKKVEITKLDVYKEETLASLEAKEKKVKEREETNKRQKILLDNVKQDTEKWLKEEKVKVDQVLRNIKEKVDKKKEEEKLLSSDIALLEDKKENLISKLDKEHKDILDYIQSGRDEIREIQEQIVVETRLLNQAETELKKVKAELKEEIEKIRKPKENLRKEQEEWEEKKKDMRIYARRLQELYQEVRPGIKIKI